MVWTNVSFIAQYSVVIEIMTFNKQPMEGKFAFTLKKLLVGLILRGLRISQENARPKRSAALEI